MTESRHLSLGTVAYRLSLPPLEVVRLLALAGEVPENMQFSTQDIQRLQEVAGLGQALFDLQTPEAQKWIQHAVRTLLEGDYVEGHAAGLGVLCEGLEPSAAAVIEQAVEKLAGLGLLLCVGQGQEREVCVPAEATQRLMAIASGETDLDHA